MSTTDGQQYASDSPEETGLIAAQIAQQLQPGDIVGLVGELGAGKSVFVRALGRALGIPEEIPITSPTYTVVNSYEQGRIPLFHFDLYRLEDEDELEAIGFRDFLSGGGVCVLEWLDRMPEAIPDTAIRVVITCGPGDNQRTIEICGNPFPVLGTRPA